MSLYIGLNPKNEGRTPRANPNVSYRFGGTAGSATAVAR